MKLSFSGSDLKKKLGFSETQKVYITRLYRQGGGISKRLYIIIFCSIAGQPFSPFGWYSEINKTKKLNGLLLRYGVPLDGIDIIKGTLRHYIARPVPIEEFKGDVNNSLIVPIDLAYFFRDKEVLKRMREEKVTEMDSGGLSATTPEHIASIIVPPRPKRKKRKKTKPFPKSQRAVTSPSGASS